MTTEMHRSVVRKGRPLFKAAAVEKPYTTIFVHSHVHTGGLLDPQHMVVPSDQGHDANALLLGESGDVLVTSLPLDSAYLEYWTGQLQLSCPLLYSLPAQHFRGTLHQSLLAHVDDFIDFLKHHKAKGRFKDTIVLSVFEADEKDRELLRHLQAAGIGKVISECNYDLLDLGTKTAWRSFCKSNGIPQLPGGVFSSAEEVLKFVRGELERGHSILLKSPHGIGGLGQLRIAATQVRVAQFDTFEFDDTQLSFINTTLSTERNILVERFAESFECEQVVDIYIDPILRTQHSSVIFDQLTMQPPEETGGVAYYGAKYPSVHFEAKEKCSKVVKEALLPALIKVGYTGPAGIDVMYRPPHPLHFVEVNMRTDAITYIKHLTDRVGKSIFNKEAGQTAFMTLVNLPHTLSFAEILARFGEVLQPSGEGVFVFTNPNRHRWHFYDVAAISPQGLRSAQRLMRTSLQKIWGEEQAKLFLKSIQLHPTPLLARQQPGVCAYPYLVSLPHNYFSDSWDETKKWPTILFLHGMDERGSDLVKVKQHGIPRTVQEHKDFPFISISPQCPEGTEHWDPEELVKLLDHVEEEFRVDPSRIYLTGCSMGGEGVWHLAMISPHRFAAIAPICGDAPTEATPENVAKIAHLPTWVLHGMCDPVVPFDDSVKMVEALRQVNAPQVHFTAYANTEHDAWTETYNNTELYQWFLKHQNTHAMS